MPQAAIILGVVVVLAGAFLFFRSMGRSGVAGDAGKAMPPERALRYRPAEGQDTAPLIAALRSAGYQAEPDSDRGQQRVLISGPEGGDVDREHVRTVIEEANHTSVFDGLDVDAPVRFEGER